VAALLAFACLKLPHVVLPFHHRIMIQVPQLILSQQTELYCSNLVRAKLLKVSQDVAKPCSQALLSQLLQSRHSG